MVVRVEITTNGQHVDVWNTARLSAARPLALTRDRRGPRVRQRARTSSTSTDLSIMRDIAIGDFIRDTFGYRCMHLLIGKVFYSRKTFPF